MQAQERIKQLCDVERHRLNALRDVIISREIAQGPDELSKAQFAILYGKKRRQRWFQLVVKWLGMVLQLLSAPQRIISDVVGNSRVLQTRSCSSNSNEPWRKRSWQSRSASASRTSVWMLRIGSSFVRPRAGYPKRGRLCTKSKLTDLRSCSTKLVRSSQLQRRART